MTKAMAELGPEVKSDLDRGATLVDDLLILFGGWRYDDYSTVRDALEFVAEARRKNPELPISMRVAGVLRRLGLEGSDEVRQ